jgi:hypothetical protein
MIASDRGEHANTEEKIEYTEEKNKGIHTNNSFRQTSMPTVSHQREKRAAEATITELIMI